MTAEELPKVVLPGDYLGAAEEFLPGRGTYEHGGRIFASVIGTPAIDPRDRTVRVEAANGVPELNEGDVVYARVDEIKTAMAICTVLSSATSKRGIPGKPEGTVHISKARDGYTETLSGEFAVGDMLLAKVLQAHPSVKLTTAPATLGVVSARCQVCHALLRPHGKELVCPRCGHQERRKLAQGPGLPPGST
ncbi:MAG TPA: exosome complex RNA-binding protein Csl4 [Thermoplasmata archaeon]|nr:exosome complex RNA-binding protein Csl4 [Thermoplasmata archaeon]